MGNATDAPRTIDRRYHVERPIGRGGMGTVWLCRDERLERAVAVKQIGALPGETTPDLARALREARSSAALNHPHIVSIYDVVEEDDQIWLVMEYVESRTLAQVIAQDGPLTPEAAVGIGAQVAQALATTHAAGTIHRDVKPGNILVTADGLAKVSDFGIARVLGGDQLTRSGQLIGTPTYFSPELARGDKPTPAVDVWALGATLYAAVEGHPPYQAQPNALALLATIATTQPPPPVRAGFLTEPIRRMLDGDPRSRWTMEDAAHVLERLREQHGSRRAEATTAVQPRAVPPVPPASPARTASADQRRRRGPGALVVAGLAALLALAAVLGFLLLQHQPSGSPAATDHSTKAAKTSPSHGPSSTPPSTTTSSTPSSTPPTSAPVTGAQEFVRSYYAALPGDTRTAWSSLSPGFQDKIGGYGSYRGFWTTIAAVSVTRTRPSGPGAVDVSLTYTHQDGSTESEVRRLFLSGHGGHRLITGDAVVG
jgi:serine/threonine protein kinase